MPELIDLEPQELKKSFIDNIVMIDVRRKTEWEYSGFIKSSHLLTFFDEEGKHDVITWLKEFHKLVTSKEQPFVLICAHANRTRTIGNYLIENLGYKHVYHLKGGIALWEDLNEEVETLRNQ